MNKIPDELRQEIQNSARMLVVKLVFAVKRENPFASLIECQKEAEKILIEGLKL
jgi:hypothetical protein